MIMWRNNINDNEMILMKMIMKILLMIIIMMWINKYENN